jgi:hypothetical protein
MDTLEITKELEAAHFSTEQAEALARTFNKAVGSNYVTNDKLDSAVARLEAKIDTKIAEARTQVLWVVVVSGLANIAATLLHR